MIDRHPALILRCAGAADVRYGVSFARDNNLPLAIRGGGHNIGGSALCDDGLVLDLSRDEIGAYRPGGAARVCRTRRDARTISIMKRRHSGSPRRSASTRPPASRA